MSICSVYIVATPWNFLNSFVFATDRQDEESYLLYVDFTYGQENPFLQALAKLENSPFKQSWGFHGKYKGAWQKWRRRLDEIQDIQKIIAKLKPDQVFVGSDRRIEFQCVMTEAVSYKPSVKGIYLDEGLFSYTCRQRSRTWRDRVLDSWIKRLMYPVDWKHPATVGASDWITEGWLLKPEKACKLLNQNVDVHKIPLEYYSSSNLRPLLNEFVSAEEELLLQKSFDLLVILPHPSNLGKALRQQYIDYLNTSDWQNIAVKKHPRDVSDFEWLKNGVSRLQASSIDLLPSNLPLELMLPILSFSCVVSAPSTALLSVKLLKQRVLIEALVDESDPMDSVLQDLIS